MYKLSSNALAAWTSRSPSHRFEQRSWTLPAYNDVRGKYPWISITFSGFYSPVWPRFLLYGCPPSGPSSLNLEGLNDRKDSKLQMLNGAKAKNESSVSFFSFRIGRFPYECVCVCVRDICLYMGALASKTSLKWSSWSVKKHYYITSNL